MLEKVLKFKKPIVQFIPDVAARLGILEGWDNKFSLVHSFLNVFAPEIPLSNGKKTIDVKIYYSVPGITEKRIPKVMIRDIVEFLEESIEKDYYIMINVDSCKIAAYNRDNSQSCFPHPLFVFGMNQEKKYFLCADFFDGHNYGYALVTYEEMEKAHNSIFESSEYVNLESGGVEWITDVVLLRYHATYKEDINMNRIVIGLRQFLNSENIFGYSKCTYYRPHLMAPDRGTDSKYLYELEGNKEYYGLAVFKEILNSYRDIEKGIDNREIYNKVPYIMYAYHELMLQRMTYIFVNYLSTNKELEDLLKKYNILSRESKEMVYMCVKYEVVKKSKIVPKIIEKIELIIERTIVYIQEFMDILESSGK